MFNLRFEPKTFRICTRNADHLTATSDCLVRLCIKLTLSENDETGLSFFHPITYKQIKLLPTDQTRLFKQEILQSMYIDSFILLACPIQNLSDARYKTHCDWLFNLAFILLDFILYALKFMYSYIGKVISPHNLHNTG